LPSNIDPIIQWPADEKAAEMEEKPLELCRENAFFLHNVHISHAESS
jgi:hypothetical protein